MTADVHDYQRMLDNVVKRIRACGSLNRGTKRNILRFRDECFSLGLSTGRVARYLYDVWKLVEWHGRDLAHVTLADVKNILVRVERSSYAPASKRDLKIALRKYVHFLKGTREMPKVVSWIRSSAGAKTVKIPEEILSPE